MHIFVGFSPLWINSRIGNSTFDGTFGTPRLEINAVSARPKKVIKTLVLWIRRQMNATGMTIKVADEGKTVLRNAGWYFEPVVITNITIVKVPW